jgi:hypothetical protein
MIGANWKSVIAATAVALCFAGSDVRAQSPSSFQNTCSNITISGTTLRASCRRIDGTYGSVSIQVKGIDNIDGRLQVTGTSPSSYQKTCRDIGINGDVLSATCKKVDASWQPSSVQVPGIANINGILKYQ